MPRTNISGVGSVLLICLGVAIALVFAIGYLQQLAFNFDELGGVSPVERAQANTAPPTWQQRDLTYRLANCPAELACTQAQLAVREAVETWDAVSGLTLNEVQEGGDIVITWESRDHGDRNSFDGPGGLVAHAAYPYGSGSYALDGDVHFDNAENWVVGDRVAPYPREIHLKTVALHEIGHALGLPHATKVSAMMWPVYSGIRQITPDDIAAIQVLYGPPNENDKPGATPAP